MSHSLGCGGYAYTQLHKHVNVSSAHAHVHMRMSVCAHSMSVHESRVLKYARACVDGVRENVRRPVHGHVQTHLPNDLVNRFLRYVTGIETGVIWVRLSKSVPAPAPVPTPTPTPPPTLGKRDRLCSHVGSA